MTSYPYTEGDFDPYQAALDELAAAADPNSEESDTAIGQRIGEAQALATLAVARELRKLRGLLSEGRQPQ